MSKNFENCLSKFTSIRGIVLHSPHDFQHDGNVNFLIQPMANTLKSNPVKIKSRINVKTNHVAINFFIHTADQITHIFRDQGYTSLTLR